MPDEVVAVEVEDESPEAAPEGEATTTPSFDETTWKKRLAGKDQALTAAQQARKAAEAELEQLRQWKAEKEQADMTEVERLKLERDQAKSEAEQAKAEAQRASLARKFPLTFDLLGDAMPADEVRLAEIEARLKADEESDEPAPRIDPNNPRRTAPRSGPRTKEDIIAEMARVPVPANVSR